MTLQILLKVGFFSVLEYELRVLHLLGRCSPHEPLCQPFLLWLFLGRVLLHGPGWSGPPPSSCLCYRVAWMVPPHPAIGWDRVSWTFCPMWLWTTILPSLPPEKLELPAWATSASWFGFFFNADVTYVPFSSWTLSFLPWFDYSVTDLSQLLITLHCEHQHQDDSKAGQIY
jgi:hypothetical protein